MELYVPGRGMYKQAGRQLLNHPWSHGDPQTAGLHWDEAEGCSCVPSLSNFSGMGEWEAGAVWEFLGEAEQRLPRAQKVRESSRLLCEL